MTAFPPAPLLTRVFLTFALAFGLAFGTAGAAKAQPETALSIGVTSVDEPGEDDDAELQIRRITDRQIIGPLRFAYGATVTGSGAVWVGAGAVVRLQSDSGWFVGGSFLPGLRSRGDGPDLGHAVQFRSGLEVGRQLRNGARISLGVDHISNAGLGDPNPGANSLLLRYAFPF